MINIDPATGKVLKEPLRTLGTYRVVENVVYFGTCKVSQHC
jgi:hypothetical protein